MARATSKDVTSIAYEREGARTRGHRGGVNSITASVASTVPGTRPCPVATALGSRLSLRRERAGECGAEGHPLRQLPPGPDPLGVDP